MGQCDVSSLAHNHAHANQMIDMSGAVRRRISARSVLTAEIIRLARLCVLIVNPIPARRSVHLTSPDLASTYVPLSAMLIRPRHLTGWMNTCRGSGTHMDAISA